MTTLVAPAASSLRTLYKALEGSQPEAALEQAFPQFARGADISLALAITKALVRIGLAGLARRFLQSLQSGTPLQSQFVHLGEQLAALPSGELSYAERARRHNQNVNALLTTRPHLSNHIASFKDSAELFLIFLSKRGNYYVIRNDRPAQFDFVFPFADNISHVPASRLPSPENTTSLVLLGVPSIPLWDHLHSMQTDNGYVPPIYVIEPDSAIFSLWLQMIDAPNALRDERVVYFVGDECQTQYHEFLLSEAWRSLPTQIITSRRPRWTPPGIDTAFHDDLAAVRRSRQQRAKATLDAKYAAKDIDDWRQRFAQAGFTATPLRIVGFTTRFSTVIQHAMRDLASAFARCGCLFDVVKQPNAHTATVDVVGALTKADYDLIIVINHLRSEFADSIPENIPYVCWIQDHMDQLASRTAAQSVGAYDLVVGHSPYLMSALYGYPLARFIPSNNLTDPNVYSSEPADPQDLETLRCDLSYVSHGSATPEQLIQQIVGNAVLLQRLFRRYLDLITNALEETGYVPAFEQMKYLLQAEQESGCRPFAPEIRRSQLFPQAARIYDRAFRHQTLRWAANWAALRKRVLKIFGGGWSNHPTLGRYACGVIETGYPLRCLAQASSINLQINGYASLHQRLLDALASGGFVLSRYNPADFIRQPFLTIQAAIRSHHVTTLQCLIELGERDASVAEAMRDIWRLAGLPLAPLTDVRRQRHAAIVEATNGLRELTNDAGLMSALADLRLAPHRAAGDIPHFARTTFDSEESLHELLDHYVDNTQARREIACGMRDDVIRFDTYDSLVARILQAFKADVRSDP
jgi:hypothetical protein